MIHLIDLCGIHYDKIYVGAGLKPASTIKFITISGDFSGEVTPIPIPNTVVKLISADDSLWVTAWESRTSTDQLIEPFAASGGEVHFLYRYQKY